MSKRIDQVIEVLTDIRVQYQKNPSLPIRKLRRDASQAVAKQRSIRQPTVEDKSLRQLNPPIDTMRDFDYRVEKWLHLGDNTLKGILDYHTISEQDWENVQRLFNTEDFLPTPEAFDIAESLQPQRIQENTYRILRDTALSRRVKEMYGHKCQICGTSIHLPGERLYAEVHHLVPLGYPHNGLDEMGNVLCVCPNHHVELDYGALFVEVSQLTLKPEHPLNSKHVQYHNTAIYKNNEILS